jgi:erythromycin esterase-like protein
VEQKSNSVMELPGRRVVRHARWPLLSLQRAPEPTSQRLERGIGVIHRPDTELISHYFYARLPDQFDAILHYDHTRAVEPLERAAKWEMGEVQETFPSGL